MKIEKEKKRRKGKRMRRRELRKKKKEKSEDRKKNKKSWIELKKKLMIKSKVGNCPPIIYQPAMNRDRECEVILVACDGWIRVTSRMNCRIIPWKIWKSWKYFKLLELPSKKLEMFQNWRARTSNDKTVHLMVVWSICTFSYTE